MYLRKFEQKDAVYMLEWMHDKEVTKDLAADFEKKQLKVEILGRGFTWLDTGLPKALLDAGLYIRTIEENQGIKIACLEEIALRRGFLNKETLNEMLKNLPDNDYYSYVREILKDF